MVRDAPMSTINLDSNVAVQTFLPDVPKKVCLILEKTFLLP
jgi:hypothetical protein